MASALSSRHITGSAGNGEQPPALCTVWARGGQSGDWSRDSPSVCQLNRAQMCLIAEQRPPVLAPTATLRPGGEHPADETPELWQEFPHPGCQGFC